MISEATLMGLRDFLERENMRITLVILNPDDFDELIGADDAKSADIGRVRLLKSHARKRGEFVLRAEKR